MKTKIISILTQKGGVGKTTTTIHLGGALAEKGYKVLLIDFDTQINLSIGYNIDDFTYNISNFLKLEMHPIFTARGDNNNIFVLAGNPELKEKRFSSNSLKKAIDKLTHDFDFILIDCPPKPVNDELSFGEIAISASDYVISPILADIYSLAGIGTLINGINTLKKRDNLKVNLLGFFFNQVEERTNDFKELYSDLKESKANGYLLTNFIRKDINIKNAMKKGKTIFEIKPYGRASQDLRKLTDEILNKIIKYEK